MSVKDLPSADLLGLTLAPMPERLAALRVEWSRDEESGSLPSRAVQVAGLVVGETVRLIRLGSRPEVTGAARELSKLVAQQTPDAATRHPESYRLAAGASVVLGVAGSPSSGGAEFTMLQSWNGKAKQTVELLTRAHGQALARSDLRGKLGDLTESHLSHLLADLESAGLALRIKEGRMVTVHLGPTGRSEHVRERLGKDPLPVRFHSTERNVDPALRQQIESVYSGGRVPVEMIVIGDPKESASRKHRHRVIKGGPGELRCDLPEWKMVTGGADHVFTKGMIRPLAQIQGLDNHVFPFGSHTTEENLEVEMAADLGYAELDE